MIIQRKGDIHPIATIILYIIIFVISIVGNVLVIVTLLRHKKMRSVTNVFLINLALGDLVLALVCMPFTLIGSLLQNFIFGLAMCKLIPYLQGKYFKFAPLSCFVAMSVSISVWTLVSISLERYFAICRPFLSRRWQTVSHSYWVITFIWIWSWLCPIPIFMVSKLRPVREYTNGTTLSGSDFKNGTWMDSGRVACREIWLDKRVEIIFNWFINFELLLLPLCIIGLNYGKICMVLWTADDLNNQFYGPIYCYFLQKNPLRLRSRERSYQYATHIFDLIIHDKSSTCKETIAPDLIANTTKKGWHSNEIPSTTLVKKPRSISLGSIGHSSPRSTTAGNYFISVKNLSHMDTETNGLLEDIYRQKLRLKKNATWVNATSSKPATILINDRPANGFSLRTCSPMSSNIKKKTSQKASIRLRRSQNHEGTCRQLASRKRVIRMLCAVVIEFFVCWTPLYVINTWALHDLPSLYARLKPSHVSFIHLLAYVSACCNPITYCFLNPIFRQSILSTNNDFRRSQGGIQTAAKTVVPLPVVPKSFLEPLPIPTTKWPKS